MLRKLVRTVSASVSSTSSSPPASRGPSRPGSPTPPSSGSMAELSRDRERTIESKSGSMSKIPLQSDHARASAPTVILSGIPIKVEFSIGERFISKTPARELISGGHEIDLVLSNSSIYWKPRTTDQYSGYITLDMVFEVVEDPFDPCSVYVYELTREKTLTTAQKASNYANFEMILQEHLFLFDNEDDCFVWTATVRKLIRDLWQELLENDTKEDNLTEEIQIASIPAPEIYQSHAITLKQNRKGRLQDRLLALSTDWVYCAEISLGPAQIVEKKWAIPIASLKCLIIGSSDGLPTLQIEAHSSKATSLRDEKHDPFTSEEAPKPVTFRTERSLFHIANELKRLFFMITSTELKVEQNPSYKEVVSSFSMSSSVGISGFLVKFSKKGKGKAQLKDVRISPVGVVKYGEKEEHTIDRVVSIEKGIDDPKGLDLSLEERFRFFTLETTTKELFLLVPNRYDFNLWVTTINRILLSLASSIDSR